MNDMTTSARTPLVSIGIPVYNGEKYIREALESVLAQTYFNFEVIISDNGSTDNTQEICERFAQNDSRIRYFRQNGNIGPLNNFTFTVMQSNGEFFTWVAHDDIIEKIYVEEAVEYLLGHESAINVTGDFRLIDADGVDIGVVQLNSIRDGVSWSSRQKEFFKYPYLKLADVHFCIYGFWRSAACRAAIKDVPESKALTGSEAPVLVRAAVQGEIVSVPRAWRLYRRHNDSAFMSESLKMRSMPRIKRAIIRFEAQSVRRLDQLDVLLKSNIKPEIKLSIMNSTITWYIKTSLELIRRMAVRFLRTGSPWVRDHAGASSGRDL